MTIKKADLGADLKKSQLILDKVRDDVYAQNLYAALCNMQWQRNYFWNILRGDIWSCSWRFAGGIVSDLRNQGDYMDWYCSGMGGLTPEPVPDDFENSDSKQSYPWDNYVSEGTVTDEIREDLGSLGWRPLPYEDNSDV